MKYEHVCPACKGTKKLKKFECGCNDENVFEDEINSWDRCHSCEGSNEGEYLVITEVECDICIGSGIEKFDSRKAVHQFIKNSSAFQKHAISQKPKRCMVDTGMLDIEFED